MKSFSLFSLSLDSTQGDECHHKGCFHRLLSIALCRTTIAAEACNSIGTQPKCTCLGRWFYLTEDQSRKIR